MVIGPFDPDANHLSGARRGSHVTENIAPISTGRSGRNGERKAFCGISPKGQVRTPRRPERSRWPMPGQESHRTGDYQVFATLDGALLGEVRGGTTGGPSLDGGDRADAPRRAQRHGSPGSRSFVTRRAAAEWLLDQHKRLAR